MVKLGAKAILCITLALTFVTLALMPMGMQGQCDIFVATVYFPQVSLGDHLLTSPEGWVNNRGDWNLIVLARVCS